MTSPRALAPPGLVRARADLAGQVGQDLAVAGFAVAVTFGRDTVAPSTSADIERVARHGGCEVFVDRREEGGVRVFVTWATARALGERFGQDFEAMTERRRQTWAETPAMAYVVAVPTVMAAALVRILEAAGYEASLDPDDEYDPDVVTVTRSTSGSVADRLWASPPTD